MTDISPPSGLKPKAKYFDQLGDVAINADAAIEMMRDAGTPKAKAMYHAFRKRLAEFRTSKADLTPEKQREAALFAAFDDVGIHLIDQGKIDGQFD